jgi:hypothetical protein
MGEFLIEANRRASLGESWRSPDALLKGFRNKNIHGLIDWQLGIDLLSVLRDDNFIPGFSADYSVALSSTNGGWIARATKAASILASALGETENNVRKLDHESPIVGVINTEGSEHYMNIVSHPLWSYRPCEETLISQSIDQLLAMSGCHHVRLIDIFNIERRVSWVRRNINNPDFFWTHDVASESADSFAGKTFLDVWEETSIRGTFDWFGERWTRVAPDDLWSAENGEWLVIDGEIEEGSVPEHVRLIKLPGRKPVAQVKAGGKYERERYPRLRAIARKTVVT